MNSISLEASATSLFSPSVLLVLTCIPSHLSISHTLERMRKVVYATCRLLWITFLGYSVFSNNRFMNLDKLFEDLETQFDAELSSTNQPQNFGLTRLSASISGTRITLERPVLGSNFVAGLVSGKAIWRFQPHRTLGVAKLTFNEKVEPNIDSQNDLEILTNSLIGRFVRYSLAGDGQQIRKGRVLKVLNALILLEATDEVLAVAIERLAWLEVHAGDN